MPAPGAIRVGSGPPLVLLHGLTGTCRIWAPVLEPLARCHDVFAPTLPGHVGGPPIDGEVSARAIADGVERIMDAAGLDRAHIAGNSLGGWMAVELGRRGRALTVVALSPAGSWTSRRDLQKVIATMAAGQWLMANRTRLGVESLLRRPRSRRAILRGSMEHGERLPAGAAVEMAADAAQCPAVPPFLRWIRTADPLGPAARQPYRVRIAWAERDRLIPFERFGVPFLAAADGAEHVTMPGVGHVPMYDDPELVARTILEVTTDTQTQ
jgi:pimeloyl-ACP methyl ester carboxylesterase